MRKRLGFVWGIFLLLPFILPVNFAHADLSQVEHHFTSGWHFFSLAANPSAELPTSILKDTAGKSIPLSGNLVGWDSINQTTVTYDAANPNAFFGNTMDHFHGYWLKIDNPVTIRFNAYKVTDPFRISLSSGMNMIGYPFESSQPTANLRIKDKVTNQTKTMQQARDAGWVSSILYTWDSDHQGVYAVSSLEGDWCDYGTLDPWQGYWFESKRDNLELIIPVPR